MKYLKIVNLTMIIILGICFLINNDRIEQLEETVSKIEYSKCVKDTIIIVNCIDSAEICLY